MKDPFELRMLTDDEKLEAPERCFEAVCMDPQAIRFVPKELQKQACMNALERNPSVKTFAALLGKLGGMPLEACMFMAERDGRILEILPERMKTQEMCEAAVKSCPAALEWTPEKWRSDALRREAAERDPAAAAFVRSRGDAVSLAAQNPACLKSLPGGMLTKAFLEAVDVERNGDPKEKAAHRRRLAFAGYDGMFLIPPEHLGAGLRTISGVSAVFGRNLPAEEISAPASRGEALKAAPERLKKEIDGLPAPKNGTDAAPAERFLAFVRHAAETDFACASINLRSYAEVHAYVQQGRNLYFNAARRQPEELAQACREAAALDGRALLFIPKERRTPEVCRIAVRQTPRAMRYLPKDQLTEEVFLQCADRNPIEALHGLARNSRSAPEWDPEWKEAQNFYVRMMQEGRMKLCDGPRKLRTERVCEAAIALDPMELKHVPVYVMTPKMCWDAAQMGGREALDAGMEALDAGDLLRRCADDWARDVVPIDDWERDVVPIGTVIKADISKPDLSKEALISFLARNAEERRDCLLQKIRELQAAVFQTPGGMQRRNGMPNFLKEAARQNCCLEERKRADRAPVHGAVQ